MGLGSCEFVIARIGEAKFLMCAHRSETIRNSYLTSTKHSTELCCKKSCPIFSLLFCSSGGIM